VPLLPVLLAALEPVAEGVPLKLVSLDRLEPPVVPPYVLLPP
jgi:hypothetical protein